MRRVVALVAFAALAIVCANAPAGDLPAHFAELPQARVEIVTRTGSHRFDVWVAADDASRARGLMEVRELPADRGMLFLFEAPQFAAFWMKDTYISLDLVFVGPDGAVAGIAREAPPLSLAAIISPSPVIGVLEVVAGTSARVDLRIGDQVGYCDFPDGQRCRPVAFTQQSAVVNTQQMPSLSSPCPSFGWLESWDPR